MTTPAYSQRWQSLAALTFARASMGFQFQCLAAASPFVGRDLGLDKAQLGWLIGLYLLPGIVFALPGGLLGARFGDRRLVLIGLALMAVGGLGLGLADAFPGATFARLMSGVGAVMLNVLVTKMVADLFDGKERLLAMSILINSWPIGIGIALLVVGPLSLSMGWRWGIASTTAFAVIGLVSVLMLYRAPAAGPQADVPGLGLGVLAGWEWTLLSIASLPWLLYNAAFQIVISFLPSFFVESGHSVSGAGRLVALKTAMFVIGVQGGGVLLKRTRRPDLVCAAGIVAWCASVLLVAAGSLPLPWIVVGGLLGGLPAAGLVSLPAEFLRPRSRGAGMGVFFTVYYLGCAVLPTLAGRLYDARGGQAALWMAVGIALALVPILWLFRRMQSAQVPPA